MKMLKKTFKNFNKANFKSTHIKEKAIFNTLNLSLTK
jgi:hypothetical protein